MQVYLEPRYHYLPVPLSEAGKATAAVTRAEIGKLLFGTPFTIPIQKGHPTQGNRGAI